MDAEYGERGAYGVFSVNGGSWGPSDPNTSFGGDVHEAQVGAAISAERPGRLEQVHRAGDVGVQELFGPVDRSVDVAFGGEVDDGVGLMVGESGVDGVGVADVDLEVPVPFVAGDGGDAAVGRGVGHGVDVDDGVVGGGDEVTDDGGADEAASAGDEDAHQAVPFR